ncbi:MAG: hypothetical protein E7620_08670 [Ruminococcaceae bacterium]|nr:hypothetical protein [Oscillospiraceae bacterium]
MKRQRNSSKPQARPRLSDLLPTGENTVLYGDRRMTVQGCRRILLYSPTEIRLQLKRRQLVIRGNDLECSSFAGGCVTLQGRILQVASEGGEAE